MRAPLLSVLAMAAALALPGALRAQQPAAAGAGTLVVTVTDDSTGQPVRNAVVRVRELPSARQRAGADGVARLASVPAGGRVVEVQVEGYAPHALRLEVEPGTTQEVPIYLVPQPRTVVLPGIAANATSLRGQLIRNGYYDRRTHSRGSFLTAEDIEVRRPRRMADIMATLRGFALIPMTFSSRKGGDQPPEVLVNTRGSAGRSCGPALYVDAVPVEADFVLNMSPGEVEAVESYSTASIVPSEFGGPRAQCGVILIWTRSTAG